MKKTALILLITLTFIVLLLAVYPLVEFDTGKSIVRFRYSDSLDGYEDNASYNELYFYNEKYDVSIKDFNIHKFWFFYVIVMEYVEGDVRQTQFLLEKEYVEHFLEDAEIIENPDNIDVAKLIEGRSAIVGNTRYLDNPYDKMLLYKLDGRYEEMYIFFVNSLVVIQVGSPDELPKFIAYK